MILMPVATMLGFLGLAVGSFLTVIIDRLHTGEQMIFGRSHCPHCRKSLQWFELLPVLSYLAQGGKCRLCKRAIPRSYPVIEISTALLFFVLGAGVISHKLPAPEFLSETLFLHTEPFLGIWMYVLSFAYYGLFASLAVAISAYDFEHRLIPRFLVAPLTLIGSLKVLVVWALYSDHGQFLLSVAVAGGSFLLFWGLWFFSKGRAMGRGDADIAFAIAVYLGPSLAIIGLLFAFWSGSILGILWIAIGRLHFKSEIPFAPFLFGGALLALVLAKPMLTYLSLFI